MTTFCLYHKDDLDGLASGYIYRQHHPDVVLVGANYGDADAIYERLHKQGRVVFVDLSPKKLIPGHDTLVLDHHVSAYMRLGDDPRYVYEANDAACALVWRHCTECAPLPTWVGMLSDYDTWKLSEEVLDYQFGARMLDLDPTVDKGWSLLENVPEIIGSGITVVNYIASQLRRLPRIEGHFAGHTCTQLPTMYYDNGVATVRRVRERGDLLLYGGYGGGGKYRYSLRSETVDVSAIAVRYGGGGHAGAAGFVAEREIRVDGNSRQGETGSSLVQDLIARYREERDVPKALTAAEIEAKSESVIRRAVEAGMSQERVDALIDSLAVGDRMLLNMRASGVPRHVAIHALRQVLVIAEDGGREDKAARIQITTLVRMLLAQEDDG